MKSTELNEKLARWCGWKQIKNNKWESPGGDVYAFSPNFLIWENCEKWLVPKLDEKRIYINLTHDPIGKCWLVWFDIKSVVIIKDAKANTLTDAFCLAVEKYIDSEEKK